jgi:CxxC motif-containing protein (DUF1111 family)
MILKHTLKPLAGLLGGAFCFVAGTAISHASLAAYEPFAYTTSIPNGTATTASGFSGNWTSGATPAIVAGVTYPDLPTADNSFSSTGGRQFVSFANSLSSGTKWISFLFNLAGNNGGNHCGVYFPNGGTGLFFGYGLEPISQTTGGLRPGSILTTGTGAANATSLASGFTGTYGQTPYLVVLKIEFNTAGATDTVTIYLNPTANVSAPDVAATYTLTSFDVGTITGIGMQNPGGGFAVKVDEIRVGETFAAVVGGGTVETPLAPFIASVTPATGFTTGGTVVTLTGSNFLTGATVVFGANAGTDVAVVDDTSITVTTPAGAAGPVNVIVQNTNSISGTNLNGFTYVLPPPEPPQPPVLVPDSVVMTGSNLTFVWSGPTNSTSVLLTATNLAADALWTPLATNLFGADGRATNSLTVNPDEPQQFFGLSIPTEIVIVAPPANLFTFPSGSATAIGLGWTASSTDGVIGYRILYGPNANSLTNSIELGNVTSTVIAGLTAGETYLLAVIAITANGESLATEATISAQPDVDSGFVALFNAATPLEPPTTVDTPTALITYLADRARDRHAREDMFNAYDHYLTWYWEDRSIAIEIIDEVARGGSQITVNYTTLIPLSAPEFRAFFRGLNTVAEYHFNLLAPLVGPNQYRAVITSKLPENRPLQIGDRMEIEISMFLQAPANGRANYYGTTFLYIVGQGIVPWAQGNDLGFNGGIVGSVNQSLDSYPLPEPAWLGGQTTLPYQYSNEPEHRFKQMAGNIAPTNGQPFLLGRRLHHTDFGNGTHSESGNPVFSDHVGKLGPKFIARSCVECHVNNGRALPPAIGAPMLRTVMRVGNDASGSPHPTLGSVLQPQSASGPVEGSATIASYTTNFAQYADGSPYSLRKPNYAFQGTAPNFFSARLAPPLVGLGLLEAVSESTIAALADPDDADQDGISGRMQIVADPETSQQRLGRLTSKGGKARLSHQIASALNRDMGVTTTIFPMLDGETTGGAPELSDADLDLMVRYVALLGVGARRDLSDAQALQGEQLFASAQCVKCHVPELVTSAFYPYTELRNQTIRPYTDLLLHDLGPGLADNMGEAGATGSEWRTPPLWNIGLTAGVSGGEAYLHDGRARTLEEAILWHGGEAEASKEAFRTMSAANRAALIKFLKSL